MFIRECFTPSVSSYAGLTHLLQMKSYIQFLRMTSLSLDITKCKISGKFPVKSLHFFWFSQFYQGHITGVRRRERGHSPTSFVITTHFYNYFARMVSDTAPDITLLISKIIINIINTIHKALHKFAELWTKPHKFSLPLYFFMT